MRPLIAILTAIFLLALTACGDDDTTSPTPTDTTKPTAIPAFTFTPTPQPTPPARVPPGALLGYKLTIFRSQSHIGGQIYIADYDGSNAYPVTDYAGNATFVSMPTSESLYYIDRPNDSTAILMHLDIPTGNRTDVFTIDSRLPDQPSVAISPGERQIAFTTPDSLDLFDRDTETTRRLLQGNSCEALPNERTPGACFEYRDPLWSPDGNRIAVKKVFYETAVTVVIDVASSTEHVVGMNEVNNPQGFDWSPDSNSICLQGQYGETSAAYVASAPDWVLVQFLGEYEEPGPGEGPTVQGCAWSGNDEIELAIGSFVVGSGATLSAVTLSTGQVRELAKVPGPGTLYWHTALVDANDDFALVNLQMTSIPLRIGTVWVDLTTGEVYPLAVEGAVVAVVPK